MLFGCVHVPNFICQAAVRLEPMLHEHPVAVTDGAPPLVRTVALNAKARALGLILGMTGYTLHSEMQVQPSPYR